MWILLALLVSGAVANDNLKVVYQWKQIDFEFESVQKRQEDIQNGNFIQENVIPIGLEVYKNRLFLTLPRWKKGVAASLAYIDLNGKFQLQTPKNFFFLSFSHRIFFFHAYTAANPQENKHFLVFFFFISLNASERHARLKLSLSFNDEKRCLCLDDNSMYVCHAES
jgi:hypothetical protein